jgi:hypothetical protein
MYWRLRWEDGAPVLREAGAPPEGRFVLHRHRDRYGEHFDLRLEQEGYLLGWRIDGPALDGGPWAVEKAPHATRWLDEDGDAAREDYGEYAWESKQVNGGTLLLQGRNGCRRVHAERIDALPCGAVREVVEALRVCGGGPEDAARLIADGATARRRAVERLCGLGRELDGPAFDEGTTRKALDGLTLEEIHRQSRAYEARFDRKYPPRPVSKPEPLEWDDDARSERALAIVRG